MRDPKDEKMDARVVDAVMTFEHVVKQYTEDGTELLSFTVRLPEVKNGEYLLIARMKVDGQRCVAFRSSDWFAELLSGFIRAIRNGSLKLREDRYAD